LVFVAVVGFLMGWRTWLVFGIGLIILFVSLIVMMPNPWSSRFREWSEKQRIQFHLILAFGAGAVCGGLLYFIQAF
jgi:uncharacterized integral membrane protein